MNAAVNRRLQFARNAVPIRVPMFRGCGTGIVYPQQHMFAGEHAVLGAKIGGIAVLGLPLVLSAYLACIAAFLEQSLATKIWFNSIAWFGLINLFCLPSWWLLISISGAPPQRTAVVHTVVLFLPLSLTILLARVIAFTADARIFRRSRTSSDVFRLAFWRTVSSTTSLLLFAAAVEMVRSNPAFGVALIGLAGSLALAGKILLQRAEGIRLRPVKSGDLYKRAHVLAKSMGVDLQRVCVVPFGRGRLTNGYGGGSTVALTDDYGHWLHGSELDFVIAHELTHIKQRHGIKKMLIAAIMFVLAASFATWAPTGLLGLIILRFCVILAPVFASDALSRRYEYEADRGAIELTGEPKSGVKALTDMYERTEVPVTASWLQELLSTHPTLSRRVEEINRADKAHSRSQSTSAR